MAIEEKTAKASAAASGKNGHSLISDAKFRQLYGLTLRLSAGPGADGTVGNIGGREAALAGALADLRAGDCVMAEQGSALLKRLSGEVAAQVRATGGKDSVELLVNALSRAMEDRLLENGRVTVVFLPEKSDGVPMAQARAAAAGAKLPVLFVDEESETAAAKAGARRGRGAAKNSASSIGNGVWMPEIAVDAQDVIAMYRVAHESIARARQGSGPTRIVCTKWQPALRGKKQAAQAGAVEKLESWLASRGLPAGEWRREIAAKETRRG